MVLLRVINQAGFINLGYVNVVISGLAGWFPLQKGLFQNLEHHLIVFHHLPVENGKTWFFRISQKHGTVIPIQTRSMPH